MRYLARFLPDDRTGGTDCMMWLRRAPSLEGWFEKNDPLPGRDVKAKMPFPGSSQSRRVDVTVHAQLPFNPPRSAA